MARSTLVWPPLSVTIPGAATEATLLLVLAETEDINTNTAATAVSTASIDSKTVTVDTDDVTITSSVLPTGAATEAKQDTGNASLSSIDGKVPANLTVTATRLLVDGSGVTQPVSAASLPLPSGAATEATLAAAAADIATIDTNISAINQKLAASFFTLPYDALTVQSKTADGPTLIVSRTGGVSGTIVQSLTITYDVDGDFETAAVS